MYAKTTSMTIAKTLAILLLRAFQTRNSMNAIRAKAIPAGTYKGGCTTRDTTDKTIGGRYSRNLSLRIHLTGVPISNHPFCYFNRAESTLDKKVH